MWMTANLSMRWYWKCWYDLVNSRQESSQLHSNFLHAVQIMGRLVLLNALKNPQIYTYTVNSRISVKIGDIPGHPFFCAITGFMLLWELKMDQKGKCMVFCMESFQNSVILRYLESFYITKWTKKLKELFLYCIGDPLLLRKCGRLRYGVFR